MVTKTFLKPTYLPTYVTEVTVVTVLTVVTVVKQLVFTKNFFFSTINNFFTTKNWKKIFVCTHKMSTKKLKWDKNHKLKILQNLKTQNKKKKRKKKKTFRVTKLRMWQNSRTQKHKMWQNTITKNKKISKTWNVKKRTQNSECDIPQQLICDKTKKLKMWRN